MVNLCLQLFPIAEILQRLGIGKRLQVRNQFAMHDVAHGKLHNLAAFGAGNIGNLNHFCGNMARGGVGPDMLLDPVDEGLVQRESLTQTHEEDHSNIPDLAGRPVLADDDTFHHFVELLDLPVDFRGADTHAPWIQRGVGPSIDNHAVMLGQFHVIAVAPYAGETFEVRRAILRAIGIVPEPDRHRREGPRADKLALFTTYRMTRLIVDIDAHAQTPALELATPHRSGRTTQREAGDDVRTSGYGRKTQVILDALVDVVEALWRERATRRKHRAQRLQAVVFSRDEGDFF